MKMENDAGQTPRSVDELAERIRPVFQQRPVRKVILFGSWARGTQNHKSDLDLIVIEHTDKRFFQRYDDFNEIYEKIPDIEIDMLIYTPEEFDSIADRAFIRNAIDNGKLIYEC